MGEVIGKLKEWRTAGEVERGGDWQTEGVEDSGGGGVGCGWSSSSVSCGASSASTTVLQACQQLLLQHRLLRRRLLRLHASAVLICRQ